MMSQRNQGIFWFSLFLALAGLGISIYLTVQHYSVLKVGILGKSFCNINSYLNCDIVLSSKYAKFATLPLAGLGLLYYLYLAGALITARIAAENPIRFLGLPYLSLIGAVVLSIFLAYVSLYILRSFCIFCSALYLINLFLLVCLKYLSEFKWRDLVGSLRKISWLFSLAYPAIIILVGTIVLHSRSELYAKEPPPAELQAYLDHLFALPAKDIDVTGRPFWGNPDAKVVFVEFSDFECPFCKLAAFNLKPWLADYQDQVKLVFFNYPLDKACNAGMQQEGHRQACSVAYAVHCAQQQGKFWEYHDEAFDRQPRFSPENLQKIAKKVGLDGNAFQACLTAESTKKAVESDIQQGIDAEVNSTPTIFVNGRPLLAWQSRTVVKKVIEMYQKQSAPAANPK